MFSLNSLNTQNQIFINLGQITSRHSCLFKQKKHNKSNKNGKQRKEATQTINNNATNKIYDATICTESFVEAVKNNNENAMLADLQKLNIEQLSGTKKTENIQVESAVKKLKHETDYTTPWSTSYISGRNFEVNKNGIATTEHATTANPIITVDVTGKKTKFNLSENFTSVLSKSLLEGNFNYCVQVRGFKTDRSFTAEMKRNPNMFNRVRDILGFSDTKAGKSGSSTSLPTDDLPRLRRLLAEDAGNLSPNDPKNKIKIAFAEGYLAGAQPENQRGGGKSTGYLKMVQQLLTIVIFLAIFISLMASVSGTVFRIQLGNQVEVDPEDISVTFDDVKGADEAKQELKDVVEFLKNPEKFSTLGGKLPKGVLLVGPPGTGKTLLARAVAGEAHVPFFHAAGPEFDEILVGQGARRVRDLFKAAKERAPCVIFIDEIDSVGAKRTNSVLHPYANQTINQLLSEMDGFHQNEGVIVLGATNRRDDLDPALLRPGRFDVEVNVPTPDFGGRKEILGMYLGRVPAHIDIDIEILARGTTGFTGADLESMVNQAAIRAAFEGQKQVAMKHLENARDKVLMGPERRSRLPDEEANLITAYHEGGHAIVAYYTKESHPLHKVTIIPRGVSLGHTAYIPARERYHVTKQQLLAMMDTMMGGRAAEELVFGADKITSGASSDLQQATSIAAHMVRDWGMSEKVGLRTLETQKGMFGGSEQLGPYTSELVDGEIKRILAESYDRAKAILKAHAKEHKALSEALIKYETLDAEDVKAIMNGEKGKLDSLPSKAPMPNKESSGASSGAGTAAGAGTAGSGAASGTTVNGPAQLLTTGAPA